MTSKNVVFRTDASIDIGTGHVMRCLTLAEALREQGAQCRFICREHPGNLVEQLRDRGFEAVGLAMPAEDGARMPAPDEALAHAHWLGARWQDDAAATLETIASRTVDWLIVDHYALDARWEDVFRPACDQLMVIDDLADRPHNCDLLLDQNAGREDQDYKGLVSVTARLMLGPRYALLRPEFAALRDSALKRRPSAGIGQVFVSLGGVDKHNLTRCVLDSLQDLALPEDCRLMVVMGQDAPWLDDVRAAAAAMPYPTHVQTSGVNMAQLMLESDLAIGAAGGTALEQCCMGLPSIFIVAAENQRRGAQALARNGSALVINDFDEISRELLHAVATMMDDERRHEISLQCRALTDGDGCRRIVEALIC